MTSIGRSVTLVAEAEELRETQEWSTNDRLSGRAHRFEVAALGDDSEYDA